MEVVSELKILAPVLSIRLVVPGTPLAGSVVLALIMRILTNLAIGEATVGENSVAVGAISMDAVGEVVTLEMVVRRCKYTRRLLVSNVFIPSTPIALLVPCSSINRRARTAPHIFRKILSSLALVREPFSGRGSPVTAPSPSSCAVISPFWTCGHRGTSMAFRQGSRIITRGVGSSKPFKAGPIGIELWRLLALELVF